LNPIKSEPEDLTPCPSPGGEGIGHEIKDPESKPVTAVIRKKSVTSFPDRRKAAVEAYNRERNENNP